MKKKFKKILKVLGSAAVIITIFSFVFFTPFFNENSIYGMIFYSKSSPQRENYISITDVERIFSPSGDRLELHVVMKNIGTKITEITNIEVEFMGEGYEVIDEKNIILNPDATVRKLIVLENQEIKKPHTIRFKINYTNPLTTKIDNYCIEEYLRYSAEPPQYYVFIENSTIC